MPSSQLSRRAFLRTGAAAALAPAALPVPATFQKAFREPSLSSPAVAADDWEWVRNLFSFPDDRVPMNAANLCPAFRHVTAEVCNGLADMDLDVSFENRAGYAQEIDQARLRVARALGLAGSDPDEANDLALVRNTSEGNNVVNNGLRVEAGQRVLLWEENHPTNREAWEIRARREGFAVDCVKIDPGWSPPEMVNAFVEKVRPETRVLTFTEVSNVSGVRLPAQLLCREARKENPDLFIHVDGAQSWGALRVDLEAVDCDSFAASAHKWFMGPREAGILYLRRSRVAEIEPPIFGYDIYIRIPDCRGECPPACELPSTARRFELLGQRSDATLMALLETQALHDLIGAGEIEARVVDLAGQLKRALRNLGLRLVTPEGAETSHGVVVFELPAGQDSEGLHRYLYRRHPVAVAGAPSGPTRYRLCPHVYNLESHLAQAVTGVHEYLRPVAA